MKSFRKFACLVAVLMVATFVSHARAANEYFDVNGTGTGSGVAAAGSYLWDDANWNTTSTGITTNTTAWPDGNNFARFSAGTDAASSNFTVTANSNHTFAGMALQTNGGGTVTIATSGGAVLNMFSSATGQGIFVGGVASQILMITGTINGDAITPLVWQGALSGTAGSLYLYGTNTFQGGVTLNSGAGVNFNNSASFGTGPITYGSALATAVLVNRGAGNFTVANAVTMPSGKNSSMIYTGNPVTFSNWTLGSGVGFNNTLNIANNEFRTAKLTINNLAGASDSNLVVGSPSGDLQPDNGTLVLTGTSTYGGITRVGLITGTAAAAAAPSTGTPALQADEGAGLTANIIALNGGVIQTSGTFTRPLSGSFGQNIAWDWPANTTPGAVGNQTAPGGGGFAAIDNDLTVNLNGDGSPLSWGDTTGDVGSKILGPLKFGSGTANKKTTWLNPIDMNQTGSPVTRTVLVTAGAGGDSAEMQGILSESNGSAGLTKTGKGTLILNQANTYTGPTTISGTAFGATGTISGGILSTSSLADGDTASGIGQSSNDAANLVFTGGTAGTATGSTAGATLQYTGGTQSTDRLFTLGTGTSAGTIDSSGTGALNFTNSGAIAFSGSGTRTLILAGSNTGANTLTPTLGDSGGATGLTKSGAGKWVLPSANTYTGTTTISAGTLEITNAGAIPGANALSLNGGTLSNATGGLKTFSGTTTLNANSTLTGADITFSGAFNNSNANRTLTVNTTGNTTLSGAVTLSSTATSRTLTIAGTGNTFITGVIGNGTSPASALTKSGTGTLTVSGANTYAGATTVSGGTLTVSGAAATLGTGNVTVQATGVSLSILTDVTNAISDTATLNLLGGGAAGADQGYVNLGAGISEKIGTLQLNSVAQGKGLTYGSTGSNAIIKSVANDEYFAGTGVILVGLLGDFNGDNSVDAGDYVTWRKSPTTYGDADGYNAWRANFGNTFPALGSGLTTDGRVPEPSSIVLLALGLVALARGQRKR